MSALLDTDELQEDAVKDLDLVNFFRSELPHLDEVEKDWLRRCITMVRERMSERDKYQAEGK